LCPASQAVCRRFDLVDADVFAFQFVHTHTTVVYLSINVPLHCPKQSGCV